MIIGDVIGNLWATKKDDKLNGLKLLVVRPLSYIKGKEEKVIIAVDSVGAGIGETVLVVNGSSARVNLKDFSAPVDATIVAIVDKVDIMKED